MSRAPGEGVTTAVASPSFSALQKKSVVCASRLPSCSVESYTGCVCVAKRVDGILTDAHMKVTKRLVRMADSGVVK